VSRILAIEPDPARAGTVRELVHEYVDAEVVLATSMQDAVAALADCRPDLIVTSAFLSPRDTTDLAARLRRSHLGVPVLTIPPGVEPRQPKRTGLWSMFDHRAPPGRPHAEAFLSRIRDALTQSVTKADVSGPPLTVSEEGAATGPPALGHRRAHRWTSEDLYWLSHTRVGSGTEVRVLNISTRGVLFESARDFIPGSVTTLHLWSSTRQLVTAARLVRSVVTRTGHRGLTYHAAAEFQPELDHSALRGTPPALRDSLAGLVGRVKAEAARVGQEAVRGPFEAALAELVAAREVRIRQAPSGQNGSVCFTVPTGIEPEPVLEATFDPLHAITKAERDTLAAAAAHAAGILKP
jgi:hypothetical protein